MNMIKPIMMTDAMLTASNITEDDHAEYSAGTTYDIEDRVIVAADHAVYESLIGSNTGNTPATSTTSWVKVGATNKWRAFDQKTGQTSSRAGSITYGVSLQSICTGIAFIGLDAQSVRVVIKDGDGSTAYDESKELVDGSPIISYFTYFTYSPEYVDNAVFENLPGYVGYTLEITISAPSGTAEVGEISFGKIEVLGETSAGTEIGYEDLSIIERDDFGNVEIIERSYFGTVDFQFVIPAGGEGRVRRLIAGVRATPAMFYASSEVTERGTTIFGLAKPLRIPLAVRGVSFATLEVEELS